MAMVRHMGTGSAVDAGLQIAARHGDHHGRKRNQGGAHDRHFETRRRIRVPHQAVGHPQGKAIHGAASGDPVPPETDASRSWTVVSGPGVMVLKFLPFPFGHFRFFYSDERTRSPI
jgi:hypothetical protein